jgi:outer membrane immunogenic protein
MQLGFASVALMGAAASFEATAADTSAPPILKAPMRSPAYDWTGFYIGVNGGGSAGRSSTDVVFTPTPPSLVGPGPFALGSVSHYMVGGLGGVQAGYNWQTNAAVVGLEADIQASGQKGGAALPAVLPVSLLCAAPCVPPPPVPTMGAVGIAQQLRWFGTARARLGFTPAERWLVYATGGLAYGEINTDATVMAAAHGEAAPSFSQTRAGWVVGGGIEAALGGGWTGKVEYLHMDLGSVSGTFTATKVFPFDGTFVATSRITDEIIRVGVNYRFGGPLVTKY